MMPQKGFLTLDSAISLAVMTLLSVTLLTLFYPKINVFLTTQDIKQAVQNVKRSALNSYRHDMLTSRCFSRPSHTSLPTLLNQDSALKRSLEGRLWSLRFQFVMTHSPYPHPIRLDVTVVFPTQKALHRVIGSLTPDAHTATTLTFRYPVTQDVSHYEQFDGTTGCLH